MGGNEARYQIHFVRLGWVGVFLLPANTMHTWRQFQSIYQRQFLLNARATTSTVDLGGCQGRVDRLLRVEMFSDNLVFLELWSMSGGPVFLLAGSSFPLILTSSYDKNYRRRAPDPPPFFTSSLFLFFAFSLLFPALLL